MKRLVASEEFYREGPASSVVERLNGLLARAEVSEADVAKAVHGLRHPDQRVRLKTGAFLRMISQTRPRMLADRAAFLAEHGLKSGDSQLNEIAAGAMAHVGSVAIPHLLKALAHPSADVRLSAAHALDMAAGLTERKELKAAYARESDPSVRDAMRRTLNRWAGLRVAKRKPEDSRRG